MTVIAAQPGVKYDPTKKTKLTKSAPPNLSPRPAGYADWLADVKARVHAAQQRTTLAVNS